MNIDNKFLLVCLQLIIVLAMSMIVEGKPTQTLVSGSYNTTTAPIPPSSLAENSVQKVLSRAYRLYNFCSDRHVAIKNDGPPVSATAGKNDQNGELVLETMMKRGALRIRIRGFYSNKYMCYNRKGRLVAKPKAKGGRCDFIEEQHGGHFRYRSTFFGGWVLGFSRRGKPLNGIKYIEPANENCSKFLKLNSTLDHHNLIQHTYNIDEHNRRVGYPQTPKHKLRHHGNKSHTHNRTRSQKISDR